jgi:type IV pilus assembly protein PilP
MRSDRKFPVKIFCLACLFLWLWGCDKQSEPPKSPKVVSQKISGKSEPAQTVDATKASDDQRSDAEEVEPQVSETQGETSEAGEGAPSEVTDLEASFEMVRLYNPEGKIDPFEPLIREEAPKKEPLVKEEFQEERKKRIPRTPLERLDLSQLKLTGVIRTEGVTKALVQEASGKGYIVSVGTFMGVNSGKVVEILKESLIVEEEVENALGKLTLQRKELKLQKPFGEL